MIWKDVIRDSFSIYFLTIAGGFLIGLSGFDSVPHAFDAGNVFLIFGGFYLSALWHQGKVLPHLAAVAALIWALGSSNMFFGYSFVQWLASGAMVFAIMIAAYGTYRILRGRAAA